MRTISLQQRLLQNLLVVVLALGLVVTGLAALATRMAAEDMARSLTRQSIKQSTAELELYFATIDRLLNTIRGWIREGVLDVAGVEELRSLIQPVLASEPQVSSFLIADSSGRELMLLQGADGWQARQTDPDDIPGQVRWLRWTGSAASVPAVSLEPTPYDPRKRPWYEAAAARNSTLAGDSIRWTGPYNLLTTKDPGITASMIADRADDQVTVIALDVLLTDISRFTQGLPLSERGGIIVLDEEARLLSLPGATPEDGTGIQIDIDAQPDTRTADLRPILDAGTAFAQAKDESLSLLRFTSSGEAWWAAREAFRLNGERQLWIQVVVPESELLGRIAALPYTLIALLLVVLAAAAWRMHAVSKRFARPISQLVAASDRLRRGDFSAPPRLSTNISELLRLERAQERMRVGLEELLRFRRDLQLAREIQQATLPRVLPRLDGFDLEVWTEPADETGGDTFDVIGIEPTPAAIEDTDATAGAVLLLADATGHGVGPALTATAVRSLLRMAVRAGQDLDAIARQMNDQLHEDLDHGRFVTAWLAELDCDTRRIRCLSAGQAPILSYHRNRRGCEIRPADGPPLGVLPGIAPQSRPWQTMAAGDIVAVLSDGIFEAVDNAGEQFGVERTVTVLEDNAECSARAIREALLEQLRAFTGGRAAEDDRTILILKATL